MQWSQIARTKIKNGRALRSLGFLKADGSPVEVEDDTDGPAAPVVVAGPTGPTT